MASFVEQTPPAYKDEACPTDKEADVESVVVNCKPLTSSLRATMPHRGSVGSPLARRWHGHRYTCIYALAKVTLGGLVFGYGYTFFSATLVSMLTSSTPPPPMARSPFQRVVARVQCTPLVLNARPHRRAARDRPLVRLQDLTPSLLAHELRASGSSTCALHLMARVLAAPTTAALLALLPSSPPPPALHPTKLPSSPLHTSPRPHRPFHQNCAPLHDRVALPTHPRVLGAYAKLGRRRSLRSWEWASWGRTWVIGGEAGDSLDGGEAAGATYGDRGVNVRFNFFFLPGEIHRRSTLLRRVPSSFGPSQDAICGRISGYGDADMAHG